jgi:hypothetical protein
MRAQIRRRKIIASVSIRTFTELKVDVVGEKKILALVDSTPSPGDFPKNFDMPLAWPMPSWGKSQLRDVYEISAGKIPSKAAGYCYGSA